VICLSDNDVIHKLAACDLAAEALAALGLGFGDVRVLPTAKHKFGLTKNQAKAEQRYGPEVLARIRDLLGRVSEIDVVPPVHELEVLVETEGIDTGEAILFASAACLGGAMLATGDKRSLRALASSAACRGIAGRIAGRVICLEQIIYKVIGHLGFPRAKEKIVPARGCDTALRAAFGSGEAATEENVLAGLESYIAELRALPVALLVP
jgi:hypothetical protein